MGSLGARIREERERLGLNQTDFAALAGQAKKSQVRYEADERSPDAAYLGALAKEGADITYIITGIRTVSAPPGSPMSIVMRAQAMLDGIPTLPQELLALTNAAGETGVTQPNFSDFAAIPRYDAQLAAGDGIDNHDGMPIGAIAFRRDWLARLDIAPGQAMVLGVRGDSMNPTLSDGDLVLVDRRRQAPRDRRIYALIGPDGEARVKRLERLPGTLVLHSDNTDWSTELIPATDADRIRILGEVVWWGHTVRDQK